MATKFVKGRTYDARPDRIDLRDRMYNPKLVSLPPQFPDNAFIKKCFGEYAEQGLVLDQGREGSCTGFGLAVVVNYLLWRAEMDCADREERKRSPILPVSPAMLYYLARTYDEWPGEQYEGSSCRGAMKAWHRHGVCHRALWDYHVSPVVESQTKSGAKATAKQVNAASPLTFLIPNEKWAQDAASRPLGAYYRVDKRSVTDIQAAINEVGAVYAAANVHSGWTEFQADDFLPIIGPCGAKDELGGHAFAMVGYTADGFIVQNSWGEVWGRRGFGILPYDDWADHAMDVWVAVLGAPMSSGMRGQARRETADDAGMARSAAPTRTRSQYSIQERQGGMASWSWASNKPQADAPYVNPEVQPWSEENAYLHTLVTGNNGRVINQFLDRETGADAVNEVLYTLPKAYFDRVKPKKKIIALYAHGGLNSEEASIKRVRVMAPYFEANGIYPVFFTWKTGPIETIVGQVENAVRELFGMEPAAGPARGWFSDKFSDAADRTIEVAAENLLVRAVWSEMKKNAQRGADREGGLSLGVAALKRLCKEMPDVELHAIGHSAGSILLGHMLDLLGKSNLAFESCHLYAPACTMGFALDHYAPAIKDKVVKAVSVDVMSDYRETDDNVSKVYGKSLLYLVSRALEDVHKMPIMGMADAWGTRPFTGGKKSKDTLNKEYWHEDTLDTLKDAIGTLKKGVTVIEHDEENIDTGRGLIKIAHGSFDNDAKVVTRTLKEILGKPALDYKVESLTDF